MGACSAPGLRSQPMLDHLTGQLARAVARTAVVIFVATGSIGYARSGKDVTLVLDGRPLTVRTDATDVQGLLAGERIVVTGRDTVDPGPGVTLSDGQKVTVSFARPLTVTVDGVPRTYWTTEPTVGAALGSLKIRTDGATLSAPLSERLGRAGLALTVSTPKEVTVAADGQVRRVTTTAATVADLIHEQKLTVRSADTLSAPLSSPVADGLIVALTRIDRRRVTVSEPIKQSFVRRVSAELALGRRKVVTRGRAGVRTSVYTLVFADGKEVSRAVTSRVVVRQPENAVVIVGAGDLGDRPGVRGTESLNWAALARCESGGNPRAVNPAGFYGLFQFCLATWRSVGGRGMPHEASPEEQLYRAKLLYARGGARQWGCGYRLFDQGGSKG
jgi:uncharacterized protein YabE (DUF348 family)